MTTVFQRRIFALVSLLIALVVIYAWYRNGLNTQYVVVVLVVLLAYSLAPRLVAEFRLSRVRGEMNKLNVSTHYDLRFRRITTTSSLTLVRFFEEDHQIASWDGDLNLEGNTFSVVESDGNCSLVSEGRVIVTSRKDERGRNRRFIEVTGVDFTLASLNFGLFPFAVYQGEKGIGYVRSNLIVLPRSLPLEVHVFVYVISLKLFNGANSRRDFRVGI